MDERKGLTGNWVRVCIDRLSEEEFSGTVYALDWKDPMPFRSYHEFLLNTDRMFDSLGYPQSFQESRSFREQKWEIQDVTACKKPMPKWNLQEFQSFRGREKTANFLVISRRKATWQGEFVKNFEEDRRHFSSDLELLKYILEE
ncbi:MAG: hypothetical protein SOZ59_06700 [Candidatus Limivivens sp.]|nr:hypothetical protein [Candidatus Limivivens sp.]